jgi:PKD repeat protein
MNIKIKSFTFSPENPVINETITFSASSSYDPDGRIVKYEWDFGDGETGEWEIVTHSYTSPGNYTVILTVKDNDGATNSTSAIIQVNFMSIMFETDFEGYSEGTTPPEFTIYYNGKGNEYQVVTTVESHSRSKSFQVWGVPGWCANVHYYFEKTRNGRIGYEVLVKANPKEEGWIAFVNPEGATWTWSWCSCSFDKGGFIKCPGGFKKIHSEDRWYKVRAEMDVKTGACWMWLDDQLVTNGVTPCEEGVDNPSAYTGIRGVVFGDCSGREEPSTPTYFDDFKFFRSITHPPIASFTFSPEKQVVNQTITFDA